MNASALLGALCVLGACTPVREPPTQTVVLLSACAGANRGLARDALRVTTSSLKFPRSYEALVTNLHRIHLDELLTNPGFYSLPVLRRALGATELQEVAGNSSEIEGDPVIAPELVQFGQAGFSNAGRAKIEVGVRQECTNRVDGAGQKENDERAALGGYIRIDFPKGSGISRSMVRKIFGPESRGLLGNLFGDSLVYIGAPVGGPIWSARINAVFFSTERAQRSETMPRDEKGAELLNTIIVRQSYGIASRAPIPNP